MRICFHKVELLPDQGLLKNIEVAGRTCYKSEEKITETSAKAFVEMLLGKKHLSVLEHGSIYLTTPSSSPLSLKESPWCHIEDRKDGKRYYYTNFRYICEAYPELAIAIMKDEHLPEGVEFFIPEKNDPYKRYSFRLITNFKISEQYVRHRVFSHSKESTRYCNYTKDRFDHETTIVVPFGQEMWFGGVTGKLEGIDEKWYFTPDEESPSLENNWHKDEKNRYIIDAMNEDPHLHKVLSRSKLAELDYFAAIQEGNRPEVARDYLTLFTKTEQVMTGFAKDWSDLIKKRFVPGAQNEARFLADKIKRALASEIRSEKSSSKDSPKYTLEDLREIHRQMWHPEPVAADAADEPHVIINRAMAGIAQDLGDHIAEAERPRVVLNRDIINEVLG